MRNKILPLLENFALYLTHSSEGDIRFQENQEYTPKILNQCAKDYLEGDHVDGKGSELTETEVYENHQDIRAFLKYLTNSSEGENNWEIKQTYTPEEIYRTIYDYCTNL